MPLRTAAIAPRNLPPLASHERGLGDGCAVIRKACGSLHQTGAGSPMDPADSHFFFVHKQSSFKNNFQKGLLIYYGPPHGAVWHRAEFTRKRPVCC